MNEGDLVDDFELSDQHGNQVSLSRLLEDGPLVLYFYPRDNTPGCTVQAMDFTALLPQFKKLDAIVVGVSKDSQKSHCNFIEKKELTIELLSDEDHKMQEAYGVWRPKKFMGREFMGVLRTTFIIGKDGRLKHVMDKVKTKTHHDDVLALIKELGL